MRDSDVPTNANRNSSCSDRPEVRATLSIMTWNTGSLAKYWQRVDAVATQHMVDIVALQETKTDASSTRALTTFFNERGWKCIWGCPSKPHSGQRTGHADIPGVAFLVRSHLHVSNLSLEAPASDWYARGRLLAIEVEGFVCVNLYAHNSHGQGLHAKYREQLSTAVWDLIAHYPMRPCVAIGDWNAPIHETSFALHSVLAGGAGFGRKCQRRHPSS